LYDFESAADPSSVDGILRALTAVWVLATLLSVVRARTLWAVLHRLSLRAVNGEGLLDAAAIHDSVLCLAVLATGVGYFFILRRAGAAARSRALTAALWGVAVSAALAIGQLGKLAPAETSGFWRATGRLSGGAVDPNALGLLCGLGLVAALARMWTGSGRRGVSAGLAVVLTAGLVLSGSRSGLLVALLGFLTLIVSRGRAGGRKLALSAAVLVLLIGLAVVSLRKSPGSIGSRLSQVMDQSLPLEYRASARPLLWESAVLLFRRHPLAGGGLGSFSWQLPDLLTELGRALPMRDNPGNAYLQALAETGAIGFLLTLALAVALLRFSWSGPDGGGAAVGAFLVSLLGGSHWFAPDVALFFFLLASVAAPAPRAAIQAWRRRLGGALVAIYAVAVVFAAVSTLRPDVTFRYRQGVGFHAKEVGPGGPFYWTQRRFAVRLEPGGGLRLILAHFTPEGQNLELTAQTDGRLAYSRSLSPGQAVDLRLSGGSAQARVIEFSVSRAFVPKRLGLSSDRRELGLVAVFPKSP
ncbi:MAG: O-antigen ligase family protein, partial [Acidobacteriota bacterium]